jgi:hypothetical protein
MLPHIIPFLISLSGGLRIFENPGTVDAETSAEASIVCLVN